MKARWHIESAPQTHKYRKGDECKTCT